MAQRQLTRITTTGVTVVHKLTMAEGEVIDICDGYRVRVDWGGRISRIDVRDLRVVAD